MFDVSRNFLSRFFNKKLKICLLVLIHILILLLGFIVPVLRQFVPRVIGWYWMKFLLNDIRAAAVLTSVNYSGL